MNLRGQRGVMGKHVQGQADTVVPHSEEGSGKDTGTETIIIGDFNALKSVIRTPDTVQGPVG